MLSSKHDQGLKLANQTKLFSKHNWFILTSLVSKDFKLKYRRSTLGMFWSVLNPFLMMCVLTAVFSFMFRFDIEYYPLYLILGTTLFSLMGDSTTNAMNSIIDSAPLIKKIRIEKIIFPFEKVVFQLINYCLSLIAVAVGFLLSALVVFFRDISHLWSVVITAWTYATPLFYPMSILPDWMQSAMSFNPMYQYVTYLRDIALWGITPSLEQNLICFAIGAVMLLVGYLVFRKLQKKFILYV